jgi:hypothetical protein
MQKNIRTKVPILGVSSNHDFKAVVNRHLRIRALALIVFHGLLAPFGGLGAKRKCNF